MIAQLLLFTVRSAAARGGGGSAERWHKGAGERLQDTAPPVALQAAIARSRSASDLEQLYILFIGANDESTGRSWCSDTRLARPLLTARLEGLPEGAVVIEAAVAREEWRRRDHPYRQHPVRTHPCGLSSQRIVVYVLRLGCVRAVAG